MLNFIPSTMVAVWAIRLHALIIAFAGPTVLGYRSGSSPLIIAILSQGCHGTNRAPCDANNTEWTNMCYKKWNLVFGSGASLNL